VYYRTIQVDNGSQIETLYKVLGVLVCLVYKPSHSLMSSGAELALLIAYSKSPLAARAMREDR